ncbi:hypothetical protein ABPG75_002508 [Micractinium tetrahymenae]
MPGVRHPQAVAARVARAEPCTPLAGRYRFGDPLVSPLAALTSPPTLGSLGGNSMRSTPAGPPRCSALGINPAAPPAVPPAPPPLAALSPRLLHAMRPCSVKLTGSVRLVGSKIIPLRASTNSGDARKPAPSVPASKGGSQRQAAAWHKELPFSDLLTPRPGIAASGAGSGSGSSPAAPLPLEPAGPLAVPVAPLSARALPAGIAAEMALTPRKRSRKSLAPARAATGDDAADTIAPPAQQGSSESGGRWSAGGRAGERADSEDDTQSAPCKLPRCK